jgi:hypothetical protein
MSHGKVYHDGGNLYVFETRRRGPAKVQYGVLVDAARGEVGDEAPLAEIRARVPDADFRPHAGKVPPAVKDLVEAAESPPDADP